MSDALHVGVVDIGNLKNLGWVVEGPCINECGTDIDTCVDVLAGVLAQGPLALGFEAPMWVPFGRERRHLDKARECDGDRPFSAGAGASVLVKGLVIVPYILGELRKYAKDARATLDWRRRLVKNDMLVFEAFVTHMGKSVGHTECARFAVDGFQEATESMNLVVEPSMNLLGAMLLRTGWSDNLSVLSEPCLVVRHRGDADRRT